MSTVATEIKPRPLTPAQRNELVRKCQSTLNWSDGGHWIGRGAEPNCFLKDNLSNSIKHTYSFPTDQSANKWNQEWEDVIRYGGHLATAAITAVVTVTTGGVAGFAVGTIAAIVKDEIQAKIPYPKMERGWSYQVSIANNFTWSPHPWARNSLSVHSEFKSFDSQGTLVNTSKSVRKYTLDELPDGVARLIASAPSKNTSSIYV